MGNREARIQAEIVAWIRRSAPRCVIFAVLNDGLYSKAEAAKRRWMGLLAGIPDLCIVAPDGHALFFEVKAPGGTLSPEQREMIARLAELGARCAVVRSVDDARTVFEEWGIETTKEEYVV